MELHPNSFLETGSCSGPRYIRSQPNRESSGVLLNSSVANKYVAEFDLPYRNIVRYVKEIENDWPKLNKNQRDIIGNSLSMFSMSVQKPTDKPVPIVTTKDTTALVPVQVETTAPVNSDQEQVIEQFGAVGATSISDCVGFLAQEPLYRVNELLTQLTKPSVETKTIVEGEVGMDSLEATLKYMNNAVSAWCNKNSYYQGTTSVWAIFIFLLIIFMLIGVGTGYNCK